MPMLIDLVRSGAIDPVNVLTQREPLSDAISAYHAFNERQPGWMKVELEPTAANSMDGGLQTVNTPETAGRV